VIWYIRVALALGLLLIGWQVAGWRSRAIEADQLQLEVEALKARREADIALVKATQIARAEAEARELDAQEESRRRKDDLVALSNGIVEPDCSFGPDSIRLLNSAGGHAPVLPGGSGDPDGTGTASRSANATPAVPD
jgi:hypothetical protein